MFGTRFTESIPEYWSGSSCRFLMTKNFFNNPSPLVSHCLHCILPVQWTCQYSHGRYMYNVHCTLGYNDFNNLVMQTLWWLPNKILRHIHKIRFSFFWAVSCACVIKVYKSGNKSIKKFYYKIQYGYQKTQNFTLISNPLKKFWKNVQTKVVSKNVTEICPFSLLLMFVKLVLLITFWGHFFTTFSTDSKSAWNSAIFDIFVDLKKINCVILALFKNFEAKRTKNGSKNQKTYFVNVS